MSPSLPAFAGLRRARSLRQCLTSRGLPASCLQDAALLRRLPWHFRGVAVMAACADSVPVQQGVARAVGTADGRPRFVPRRSSVA